MTKGEALRDRTAAAIIDGAATVLAERGDAASMEEIAGSVGVGRATLYRYFPNRDELLKAIAAASIRELAARVKEADLDVVPFEEGIARLARGIIVTGNKYMAVSGISDAYPEIDVEVVEPIRALFRRAIKDGSVRADIPPDLLVNLFSGLVRGALDATASGTRGIEETAAAVTTLFLRGARTA